MKTRALLSSLLCWLSTAAHAADLPLPAAAAPLPARIAAACPECAARGYTPCGSPAIAWGRRYAPTALLGTPKRGYLVTFTMTADEFRRLARATPDHASLVATLRERFATTRVVVVADGFADARVLPPAAQVEVTFPEPLHRCLHETANPWGCCVSDCKQECCEKDLGSPRVDLEWQDGTERLHFHYTHTTGTTWLKRTAHGRETHYFCLTDAKGSLTTR